MKPTHPPRWATYLLSRRSHPDTREEVEGDLLELYAHWVRTHGPHRANWLYALNALRLLRPFAKPKYASEQPLFLLHPDMLTNYLKVAGRSLWRNKLISTLSIVGLALGMTVSLLIVLFVAHECSFDKFHSKGSNIVKVELVHTAGDQSYSVPWMSYRFGEAVNRACADVIGIGRIRETTNGGVVVQSDQAHKFHETGFCFADSGFLQLFDFGLIQGNPRTVLSRPNTVLLTEATAYKYFGNTDPLGKTITLIKDGTKLSLDVVGVLRNVPSNSTIHFDFLADITTSRTLDKLELSSFLDAKALQAQMESTGASGSYHTYLLLRPNASVSSVAAKIPGLLSEGSRLTDKKNTYRFFPLRDLHFDHLYSAVARQRVLLYSAIAFLVLLLALVNYVNLATARATRRAKEVGVRKVAGAARRSLVAQFYVESAVQVIGAFGLSLLLLKLLLPEFIALAQVQIDTKFLRSVHFIVPAAAFLLACVGLSGAYPALLLSAFSPIKNLKNQLSGTHQSSNIRLGLTVVQFTISASLIISTLVINNQLDYLLNTKVGIDRQRIVAVPLLNEASALAHYTAIREEINQLPNVEAVGGASLMLYDDYGNGDEFRKPNSSERIPVSLYELDRSAMAMLNIKWAAPPIRPLHKSERSELVINEVAARALGVGAKQVGQPLTSFDGRTQVLAGIVKDFDHQSLYGAIKPAALYIANDTAKQGYLYVKLTKNAPIEATLDQIGRVYDHYSTDRPFAYQFLDNLYRNRYKEHLNNRAVIRAFSGFALLLACMGLFGLATYAAEQRTKEIGIRKVLGATTLGIASLLSRDLLRPVLLGIVLAVPIVLWAMRQWLSNFAYRVEMGWWLFVSAAGLVIGIALITVSFQSIRAALADPVKSLRSE